MAGQHDSEQERAVAELREKMGPLAEDLKDRHLRKLAETCQWDADFAYTAVMLFPRPEWVAEIIGTLDLAPQP